MTDVYQASKALFPQLESLPISVVADHADWIASWHDFYAWFNQDGTYLHYMELKEFWVNGVDNNAILRALGIDGTAVQAQIDAQIDVIMEDCDDEYLPDGRMLIEVVENAIYDGVLAATPQGQYCVLRVLRENPYWLLAPNDTVKVDAFIQAFNETFNDGDMLMVRHTPE